jgi:hypothetical protein
MAKEANNDFERRANHLLRSLQLCGGCVPLHRLQFQFSDSVIQTLLDKELVQVQNTGRGFLLEIAKDFPATYPPYHRSRRNLVVRYPCLYPLLSIYVLYLDAFALVFKEDSSTIRLGNAPANLSIIRAIALNILPCNGYHSITIAQRFLSHDIDKLLYLVE